MPVQKIPYAHRFGIVSHSYKVKIENDILQRQQDTEQTSTSQTIDQNKKQLVLEVTEDFVRDYNRSFPNERLKLNASIYRMLERLKRKASQCQIHTNRPIQLQMAWAELCLLSQCRSPYQKECLTTLYRALIYSPLSAAQIPTLFFLSETVLYWLKNDAVLEPFLTSTELKLLKIGQIVFQLLYFHYLEGSTGPYEEFKIRLFTYLEGLEDCESAYSSYPNAVWCIRYIESVGSILVASVDKSVINARRSVASAKTAPVPVAFPEDYREMNKSELSAAIQELSPIIWHSVDVWLFVKRYSTTNLSKTQMHFFKETILSLLVCRHKLIDENWIDVVLAFQILCDVAKSNVDILETVQLLAEPEATAQVPLQKRAESHLLSRGWRSWPWQLIILLSDCLTSICIGAEQTIIKRTALFGSEVSSDNILSYARTGSLEEPERQITAETSTTRRGDDLVSLMQIVHFRPKKLDEIDEDDQSWRIRYTGLLAFSQVYKHLHQQNRHKTLTNLVWIFIDEFSKNERDERVLEALKVGRFDDEMFQKSKIEPREVQAGTIYTSIAQRLADGLLTDPTPIDLISSRLMGRDKLAKKSSHPATTQESTRFDAKLPPIPPSHAMKNTIQIKKIIEGNINTILKRKDEALHGVVIDRYRKELETSKEETNDIVEQLDSMISKAKETTTYDPNVLSSVFTVANKKYIKDPMEERRALAELLGQTNLIDDKCESTTES